LRSKSLLLLTFTSSLNLAQQAPQRATVVVTGTFEPMSLEEIDRAIRVLPARGQSLLDIRAAIDRQLGT